MPVQAIKGYKQKFNAFRFIWHDDWETLHGQGLAEKLKDFYEDGDTFIHLMCHKDGGIKGRFGFFAPENAAVPEGFSYIDFPKVDLVIGWLRGKEKDIYGNEPMALDKINEEADATILTTDWWFERESPKRWPLDENGDSILDIGFFALPAESEKEATLEETNRQLEELIKSF